MKKSSKAFIFCSIIFCVIIFSTLINAAINLNINSPYQNGTINYNTKKILFNLSTDELSSFYYINDIPALKYNWIKLCSRTASCIKFISLNEGNNKVKIKAINSNGASDIKTLYDIFIDTKKPLIKSVYPKPNNLINKSTEFIVDYDEENLDKVILYYGYNEDNVINKDLICEPGINKECKILLTDLSNFDGDFIVFWFEIKDQSGHLSRSKINKVKVDMSPPIVDTNIQVINNRVRFIFEVQETNFKGVYFYDSRGEKKKWTNLCSSLIAGRCTAIKSFPDGNNNIIIRVLDKAGNYFEEQRNFHV